MKFAHRILLGVLLAFSAIGCPSKEAAQGPAPTTATPPDPLPEGHPSPQDTTPKEGPRLLPAESYIRSYLSIFGGLSPLAAQTEARGKDGVLLFNSWAEYLGAIGMPDYRYDVPRMSQTNALMVATFERIGVALCDRAVEHDRTIKPRAVFDFDMPATLVQTDFAPKFDVLHRTFLNYPASMAPTDRTNKFWHLYESTAKAHASVKGSRFSPPEAAWAAVCYGLVRHPEFHVY